MQSLLTQSLRRQTLVDFKAQADFSAGFASARSEWKQPGALACCCVLVTFSAFCLPHAFFFLGMSGITGLLCCPWAPWGPNRAREHILEGGDSLGVGTGPAWPLLWQGHFPAPLLHWAEQIWPVGRFLSGNTSCPSLCCEGTLTSKPRGSKSAHPHGHGPRHLGDMLVRQKIVIFCLAEGRAKCPDAQGHNHLFLCFQAHFPQTLTHYLSQAIILITKEGRGWAITFTPWKPLQLCRLPLWGRLNMGCGGTGPLAVLGRRLAVIVALLRVLFQPCSGSPQAQVVLELLYSFSVSVVLFASGRTLTSK